MSKIGIDARLWNETGVGRYIRNLVKELQILDQKNEYVLFVLSKDKEEISKTLQFHSGKNDQWSILAADIRWHSIEEQVKFGKVLEKENLDLVHFPYFSVPIRYRKPFVVTIHDLILHHFPTGKASTLPTPMYYMKHYGYKFVIAQAAKKAKKIITVSEATAEQIVKDLKVQKEKIVVTYEGVDEKIQESSYKVQKLENETKYFLYVGNVYPHKNTHRLLEAFKAFKNMSITDAKLIFVGRDDYFYQRLREEVKRLDLEADVKILNKTSDGELIRLYQHANALVVPSLMEGFGLPGIEAMANSCVVIASDIPSLKEIYADVALYVDPISVEGIAQMLKKVYFMETDKKEILRKKGKERIKKFSWKTMAAQTLAVYESSIGIR